MELEMELAIEDAGDFLSNLKEINGVEYTELEAKRTHPHERVQQSVDYLSVALTLVAAKVLPEIVRGIRDVVIEHMRHRSGTLLIRTKGGEEIVIRGPIKGEDDEEAVRAELARISLQNPKS